MRTKIYGTIGPACCDTDTLARLFEQGMTGIRINLSHSDLAEAAGWIANIHSAWKVQRKPGPDGMAGNKAQERCGKPEIIMDLRGPELRIGKLAVPLRLTEGRACLLREESPGVDPAQNGIPVPALVLSCLRPGQDILLDDGKILLRAEGMPADNPQNRGRSAVCRILRGGTLSGGKSIALSGTALRLPTLTESDLENIRIAKTYGITGVMLPFVRDDQDLLNLRKALKEAAAEDIRVFAKIENLDGVGKISALLPHCDEIVIARGDLGNAVPLWRLPVIQAQIAESCRSAGKPFMVVTQMLATMEISAVPTRAEVSDIFRAVQEGAASVMLTGETAAGKYPDRAMEYMVKTVREAENYLY